MSALNDVDIKVGRRNYMSAYNRNPDRAIRLTYEVKGLPNGPRSYTKDLPAGGNKELGIINAGGGQMLSYAKVGAEYRSSTPA